MIVHVYVHGYVACVNVVLDCKWDVIVGESTSIRLGHGLRFEPTHVHAHCCPSPRTLHTHTHTHIPLATFNFIHAT